MGSMDSKDEVHQVGPKDEFSAVGMTQISSYNGNGEWQTDFISLKACFK
jgi:hypothetical protein